MCEEGDAEYVNRMGQLDDLKKFINRKRQKLYDIMWKIGWCKDDMSDEKKVQCCVNPGHWVAQSSLEKHEKMCSLLKEGYSKEDLDKKTPSSHFFYTNSTSTVPVLFGKEQLESILSKGGEKEKSKSNRKVVHMPETVDRHVCEFSPRERLAIYDYVVTKGKAANKPVNLKLEDLMIDIHNSKNDEDEKPKTGLELLAAQRDYKRRRQSYRAKKIHLSKKSYTEIIREVINNHSNVLAEVISEDNKKRSHLDEEKMFTDKEKEKNDKKMLNKDSKKCPSDPKSTELLCYKYYDSRHYKLLHTKRSKSKSPHRTGRGHDGKLQHAKRSRSRSFEKTEQSFDSRCSRSVHSRRSRSPQKTEHDQGFRPFKFHGKRSRSGSPQRTEQGYDFWNYKLHGKHSKSRSPQKTEQVYEFWNYKPLHSNKPPHSNKSPHKKEQEYGSKYHKVHYKQSRNPHKIKDHSCKHKKHRKHF